MALFQTFFELAELAELMEISHSKPSIFLTSGHNSVDTREQAGPQSSHSYKTSSVVLTTALNRRLMMGKDMSSSGFTSNSRFAEHKCLVLGARMCCRTLTDLRHLHEGQ